MLKGMVMALYTHCLRLITAAEFTVRLNIFPIQREQVPPRKSVAC